MTTHRKQTQAIRSMLRHAARGVEPDADEVDELRRLRTPRAVVDATLSAAQAAVKQYDPSTIRTWTIANRVGDRMAEDVLAGLGEADRGNDGDDASAGKILEGVGVVGDSRPRSSDVNDKRSVPWRQSLGSF